MSKLITAAGITPCSFDAITRLQARKLRYCELKGAAGGVQRVRYFYPHPDGAGGYCVIPGADVFGGRARVARAIAHAQRWADHPAA